MGAKPETTAYLSITYKSWQLGRIQGEVSAAGYKWQFKWQFNQKKLIIEPPLGRALIQEPLGRFLERSDYQLEVGSNYTFIIRAKF